MAQGHLQYTRDDDMAPGELVVTESGVCLSIPGGAAAGMVVNGTDSPAKLYQGPGCTNGVLILTMEPGMQSRLPDLADWVQFG